MNDTRAVKGFVLAEPFGGQLDKLLSSSQFIWFPSGAHVGAAMRQASMTPALPHST